MTLSSVRDPLDSSHRILTCAVVLADPSLFRQGDSMELNYQMSVLKHLRWSNTYIHGEDQCCVFRVPEKLRLLNEDGEALLRQPPVIIDDTITIKFTIRHSDAITAISCPLLDTLKSGLQQTEKDAIIESSLNLFETGCFSDFTFIVGPEETKISAHRNILCSRSSVFSAMVSTNLFESETHKVRIIDVGAKAFKIFLRHVYTGELDTIANADQLTCMEVAYAANKYLFESLKNYALMTLVVRFINHKNAIELFRFVKTHQGLSAILYAEKFIIDNIGQIIRYL